MRLTKLSQQMVEVYSVWQFLRFSILPGSAEAPDRSGGKVRHVLIAYFHIHICTKIIKISSLICTSYSMSNL